MTWFSVLVASVLGSLHCVGMCGGLVSFYSAGASGRSARWSVHLAYHLTRLAAYCTLGAIAGRLGSTLDGLGAQAGFGQLGAAIAMLTLVLTTLPRLIRGRAGARLIPLGRAPSPAGLLARLERAFATLAQRARRWPAPWRAGALGLSSALLPCGWLYAFVVLAAGTGSAGRGATLLLAFWAGTVPALLGLGLSLGRLTALLGARLPRLSAALIALACIFNVATRWPSAQAADDNGVPAATPSCHHAH